MSGTLHHITVRRALGKKSLIAGGNILEQTGYFDLRKLQWRVNDRLTRRVTHWKLIEEEEDA